MKSCWRLILAGFLLGALWLFAGCASAPPTPTPIPEARQSATPVAVAQPASPSPSPTRSPTATPSPTPTATPSPTPTATPSPTPTATPSPTPTARPPVETAAQQPGGLLSEAIRLQHYGDYEAAIPLYQAVLDGAPAPEQAREAHYHLAESYLLSGDYAAAAAAWEAFLPTYPTDSRLAHASLMLARAYHKANDCARAVPSYQAYLAREKVLADMAHEWIGDCYAADLDPAAWEKAIAEYRLALATTGDRSVQVGLREKIAGIYLARADYAGAVAEYDAILAVAKIEDYRAKIDYLAGQALGAAGQIEEAHARYLRAVNSYPKAEYAYQSLVELVGAGVEVDDLQRGIVDYYAGKGHADAYGAAIRAFDRYLAATPAPKADQALYLKALSQRAVEEPGAALKTLQALVDGYPNSQYVDDAWLEQGAAYAAQGDTGRAVKAYQDLAALFPASSLAPQALLRVAKLHENGGAFALAAAQYQDLQSRFPAFESADEALWQAGLAHYRAGDPQQAAFVWGALLAKYPQSAYRLKTLYWLGKLGAKPEGDAGYWDQVVEADPNGYYALRIAQIRSGGTVTASRMITGPVEPPAWDAAEVQAEIGTWLAGWAKLPVGAQGDGLAATLPVTMTQRADFRRAEALLGVGMRREALAAFDTVRAAAWSDPPSLAPLTLYWHDQGLYGLAARGASRLASLWPDGSIHTAPPAIQRLSYPLAYAELLSIEAGARDLDPLLLAALIRQESLFEPAAESYAGARGLGQVMPATGEGIARSLEMADFVLDDLYRPWVSVRFGAYYLSVQLNRFDDQILVALAAYNGGPGNTLRWLEAAGDDLDLFVEVITASQSRIYLQRVYEQYITYERLYRTF
ncbi:MAG: transglycosylase SLT domain-containing protein [Anaerolineae bacterium]|nr:transglycosylase SLT domain-containing protein [Anaerolineae bacterium]